MKKRFSSPIDKLKNLWYNISVSQNTEVNTTVQEQEHSLGFLFKKSTLPKSKLNALLQHNEFVAIVDEAAKKGLTIDDLYIYTVVKDLYFPMLRDFKTAGFKETYKATYGTAAYKVWSHKFATFGDAVKKFSKDIFNDPEHWKSEFDSYITQ